MLRVRSGVARALPNAQACQTEPGPSAATFHLHSSRERTMQNRKGFTLIELLIVVVIIGILAAIAIPKFANTKEKAVVAGMKSDLRNLVTAQEAFFADNKT